MIKNIGMAFIATPNPFIAMPNLPGSAFTNPSLNIFIEEVNFSIPLPFKDVVSSFKSSSLSFKSAARAAAPFVPAAISFMASLYAFFNPTTDFILLSACSGILVLKFISMLSVSSAIVIYYKLLLNDFIT